ncbi:MAG: TonB-dependent receptor, partial [Acidimicrobiia bacterium]|nr:TonB-dependent receptor [Acidimicrobiia bacterium]
MLSLGAPAEYGNLTGAVYNVVTRQGTNEFHGDVNYYFQSDSLTGTNTEPKDDGVFDDETGELIARFPYTTEEFTDYSVQLGGPIAKDRLWFFASYNKQEDGWLSRGADPSIGPLASNFDDADRLFLKANLQINPSHSVVFSYNVDEHSERVGIDDQSAPSTAWKRTTETPTPSLGYTAVLSDRTLLDVRATGFRSEVFLGPSDPSAPLQEPRFLDIDRYYYYGGHYYFYDLEPTRTTMNAKLSHLADDFLGASHDFRFGVQYNDSSAGGIYGYNDFVYTYSISYPGYGYGFSRPIFSYSGNTEALGLFLDDTIRVNDRLTLNFGVRYDENRAYSEAQDELDENGNPTGVRFDEVEHYTWEYISPRFGFNYQLTGDGRTVLKGHFGRYHRAIATGEFANVIGPSIKPYFAGVYDTFAGDFEFLDQITDNTNLLVDSNYKSPRTDQFILSLERQLKGNIGLALNLVYKRGRDFAAWRDIGGIYESVT